MDMGALPPFWLAYLSDPSDSGRIHSNVRERWLSGTSSWLCGTAGFWVEGSVCSACVTTRAFLQGNLWSWRR